jgi:hypothetical protein
MEGRGRPYRDGTRETAERRPASNFRAFFVHSCIRAFVILTSSGFDV